MDESVFPYYCGHYAHISLSLSFAPLCSTTHPLSFLPTPAGSHNNRMIRRLVAPETDAYESDGVVTPINMILAVCVVLMMIGVGASCERDLFVQLLSSPKAFKAALVGVACQFGIMPFVAYLLTRVFGVTGYTALGFIVVGCLPGGSASNVMTIWYGGVLELSVFMTIASTLLAFGMTPLSLYVYSKAIGIETSELALGQVAIAFASMIVPLSVGFSLTYCKPAWKPILKRLLNALAMLFIAIAIVTVIIDNIDTLRKATWRIYVPAVLYFPISASIVFCMTSALGMAPNIRRTIVPEVGLQNLVLGYAVAEVSVEKQSHWEDGIQFAILYAVFVYVWVILLIPVFRWERNYNAEHNVPDCDASLWAQPNEEDDPKGNDVQEDKEDQEEHTEAS